MAASRSLADIRLRPMLRLTLLSLAAAILLAGATVAGCFACATHMLGAAAGYAGTRFADVEPVRGVEPLTYGLQDRRSDHLSYTGAGAARVPATRRRALAPSRSRTRRSTRRCPRSAIPCRTTSGS
jgi:hypothetical protein